MMVDVGDDFTLFRLGVSGKGKRWTVGQTFGGSDDGLWGRCVRRGFEGVFDKGDSGVSGDTVDGGVGFNGGGHVWLVVVLLCCRKDLRERMETLHFFRLLLFCSDGESGFFRW